jgi:hypothetical protein
LAVQADFTRERENETSLAVATEFCRLVARVLRTFRRMTGRLPSHIEVPREVYAHLALYLETLKDHLGCPIDYKDWLLDAHQKPRPMRFMGVPLIPAAHVRIVP